MALMDVYDQLHAMDIVYRRVDIPYYQLTWRLNRLQLVSACCGDRKYCNAVSTIPSPVSSVCPLLTEFVWNSFSESRLEIILFFLG
jgi:hypothetical protein